MGEMSSAELSTWMAFEAIDGAIGSQRADLRAGIVAATIANCHRSSKSAAFKPHDFMPYFEAPKPTPDEALAQLRMMTGGGKR
jgi:hypothetical protein